MLCAEGMFSQALVAQQSSMLLKLPMNHYGEDLNQVATLARLSTVPFIFILQGAGEHGECGAASHCH